MTDEPELMPAAGKGADLFDPPTEFFLTHRESIERWYALKSRADDAIHQFLVTMGDEMAALGLASEWTMQLMSLPRSYYALMLVPPGAPEADDAPTLGVGLGWKRDDVAPDDPSKAPYVGVRVFGKRSAIGLMRERFLGEGNPTGRHLRESLGYSGSRSWPAYTYVPGPAHWWADLDAYRAKIMDACSTTLSEFESRLMETVI